jgi:TRAP-type mannitol/chloroaromatic compound transport system permease large subunit
LKNLSTSLLTLPLSVSLFYLRGGALATVPTTAVYRGAVPLIGVQFVGLCPVILFLVLVTELLCPS